MMIRKNEQRTRAEHFCQDFLSARPKERFVFGTNEYAGSIAKHLDVAGFVDDFSADTTYIGKPILKTEDIPSNALVVSTVVVGRPLTASKKLTEAGIRHLDYFAFYEYSGLGLLPVKFWFGYKSLVSF